MYVWIDIGKINHPMFHKCALNMLIVCRNHWTVLVWKRNCWPMPYLFSWSFRDGRAIFYELTVLCSLSTLVQCARRWLVTSLLVNQLTWFGLPGLYQGDQNAVWKAFPVKVSLSKFIFETAMAAAKILSSNYKLDIANFSEIFFLDGISVTLVCMCTITSIHI